MRRRKKMENLPNEIITNITDKLNVKDLYAFRETQKNWADIIPIDKVLEKKTIDFLQYFKDNLEQIDGFWALMDYFRLTQGDIKSVDQIISMVNILTFEEFIYFLKLYQSILNSTRKFLHRKSHIHRLSSNLSISSSSSSSSSSDDSDEDEDVLGFGNFNYEPEIFAHCIFSGEKIYDQLINKGEFWGSLFFNYAEFKVTHILSHPQLKFIKPIDEKDRKIFREHVRKLISMDKRDFTPLHLRTSLKKILNTLLSILSFHEVYDYKNTTHREYIKFLSERMDVLLKTFDLDSNNGKIEVGKIMREKKDESYYKENSQTPSATPTKVDESNVDDPKDNEPKVDLLSPFSNH